MVRLFGCQAIAAEDAASALVSATSMRPDAILLDIALPDGGGTDVLNLARETLKRGAFDYVMKPFTGAQLRLALETALAHSAPC